MKTGMGMQGFVWWEGVVEDNTDPLAIGRCRVRCLGWDSASKLDVPTGDLPWAYPMLPLNSPSKVFGLKPGTRVLGFFRDGESGQDRVMLGVINTGTNYVESNYASAGLGGTLGAIGAVAGPLISMAPVAGQLAEDIPGVSVVAEKVTETVDAVNAQIDAAMAQVTDVVEGAMDSVTGVIEGAVDTVEGAVEGVAEGIGEAVEGVFDEGLDDTLGILDGGMNVTDLA